jgi:hypothetical protein
MAIHKQQPKEDNVTTTEEAKTEITVRESDVERGEAELNAATLEALQGPEPIPDRQQFLTMAATARMLSLSPAAPKAMRNPYVAFHVVMLGRALDLDPATAMNLIDAIGDSDKLQLSLSPELLVARVEMKGLGHVELLWATKTRAAAVALTPDGRVVRDPKTGEVIEVQGERGRVEFDWDMADDAELVDDRCVWDQEADVVTHWVKPGTNGRGWSNNTPNSCKCGSYKKHPGRMMGWRAMGFCVHTYFPEASLGLYSAEELGASVDEAGRAIDPTTVELPEGYETTTTIGTTAVDDTTPATPEQIADIRWRVAQLPEAQRDAFTKRWTEKVNEGRLTPVAELMASKVALGLALLQGAESLARKDGWEPPEYPADVVRAWEQIVERRRTAVAPQDAPPAPGGSKPPSGASEDDRDAQGTAEGNLSPSPALARANQIGQPVPLVTDAVLDRAIDAVRTMTVRQLNARLRERGLAVERVPENLRRQNLAKTLAGEYAQADWDEANR